MRTIQAAANTAAAGDTVYVEAGTYNERPTFGHSGTSASPIVFAPYGSASVVISQGFAVTGSYNRVSGFTVTPGTRSTSANSQIAISGSYNVVDHVTQYGTYGSATGNAWNSASVGGTYNMLSNIDFHDCGDLLTSGSYNTISGGTIYHTGGSLAVLEGSYNTLQGLDMHDSGNTTDGQIDTSGNGSDGINLNGSHLAIRGNKIYHIFLHSTNQHEDAIQWWNQADDLVIENNQIGSRAVGGLGGNQPDAGHIQFETDYTPSAQRVIIRNNVFIGTGGTYVLRSSPTQVIAGKTDNWQIVGNTFDTPLTIRGDILVNMHYLQIKDNIFTTGQTWTKGTGSDYDYNAWIGVAKPSTDGSHSFQASSAGWVNPDMSSATNYGVNSNLHLVSTSALKGKGVSLTSLTLDKDGATRPVPPTPGAYDFGTTSTTTPPPTNPPTSTTPPPTNPPTSTTPPPTTTTTPTPTAIVPSGTMALNDGVIYTNSTSVKVTSNVTGAATMRIDPGTGYGAWMPYATTTNVTVPSGDGTKTVTAQYMSTTSDTTTIVHHFVLDTQPPSGWFTLNGGATQTTSTTVSLKSYVTGAGTMRIDTGSGYGPWIAYADVQPLLLPAGDGTKFVAIQYADEAGNVLNQATSIQLVTPIIPTGTMALNDGVIFTNSTSVKVTSNVTGAAQMRIDPGTGYGAWMPYTATANVTVPSGDGTKTVTAQYMSTTSDVATIVHHFVLDTQPPTGWFTLNGGSKVTNSTTVTLKSYVTGATVMRINAGWGYGSWLPYAAVRTITLPSGSGYRPVSVQYADQAGNVLNQATWIRLF